MSRAEQRNVTELSHGVNQRARCIMRVVGRKKKKNRCCKTQKIKFLISYCLGQLGPVDIAKGKKKWSSGWCRLLRNWHIKPVVDDSNSSTSLLLELAMLAVVGEKRTTQKRKVFPSRKQKRWQHSRCGDN